MSPYEIRSVEHLGGHRLLLEFADGLVAEIDRAERLHGDLGSMFEALRDETYFAQVRVDAESGTVVWRSSADLAPAALHDQARTVA